MSTRAAAAPGGDYGKASHLRDSRIKAGALALDLGAQPVHSVGPSRRPPHAPAPSAPARLRVAVDVDEVLGQFLVCLNRFLAERHGMRFTVSDYDRYVFASVWQCSTDHSNHIVHEFFQSPHFAAGIPPIPGALESLRRLSAHCDLVVVTSRQHAIREPTLAWIEAHFPGVFGEVHFGNHFALAGASRPKSEICREIGAQVLVDDNPGYARECADAGIDVLLYDWGLEYPWSKGEGLDTHPRIRRVTDWRDAERHLLRLAARHAAALS